MKSILLSIKPEWLAKILNKDKTIEVRKKFPKDYVGWVYLYCSKGNKKNWHLIEVVDTDITKIEYEYDYYIGSEGYLDWCLEGKVVARFWCDKVEEIVLNKNHFVNEQYSTDELDYEELLKQSCLTYKELDDYLQCEIGFAIHISKLEIFDEQKELSEFKRWKAVDVDVIPDLSGCSIDGYEFASHYDYVPLTKAPQNYCYIEGEE